jgi:2-isopropylmalate synthase
MGYELDRDELDQAFARFKDLADRKGRISAADLEAIVGDEMRVETADAGFTLEELHFAGATNETPHARVVIADAEGARHVAEADGDGPVDALMKAIDAAAGSSGTLLEYSVSAVTSGKDALGEARVVCEIDGRRFAGQSVSTDVLEASAIAYVRAVNASRHAEHGERVAGGV